MNIIRTYHAEGISAVKEHWKKTTAWSVGIAFLVWTILLVPAVIVTVYNDHVHAYSEIAALQKQITEGGNPTENSKAGALDDDSDSVVAAGSNQATATPVSALYNVVISAAPGTGIILSPVGHRPLTIKNISSVDVLVYPPIGAAFDGVGTNQPIEIYRNDGEDTLVCISAIRCTD